MVALQADAEAHGAMVAFRSPVAGGEIDGKGVTLHIGGADPVTVHARQVINAGGLNAHKIAASIDGMDPSALPTIRYAKGNYFGLAGKAPFSRLIYPVPEQGGLGVHLTYDLAGRARFGPDVEWVDEIDYTVDETRADPFYAAVRRYWPDLPDGSLYPDYSGIRTKIVGLDPSDFVIDTSTPGLINLFGIESPGLTSSLAIAEHVRALVD
jgi:L-2-hydroxyglutarate oxidase LhgO